MIALTKKLIKDSDAQVKNGDYYVICDQNGNFFAKTFSGSSADLIAAAPELLEAAKMALNRHIYPTGSELEQKLIAAIAKAEGR